MKRKTIEKIIRGKFNEFVDSIADPKVRKLVEKDTIITGGCIVSMFLNEPVNDFDIYFRTKETAYEVAKYYVDKFLEREGDKYKKGHERGCSTINIEAQLKDDRVSIFIRSAGIAKAEADDSYTYFETVPDEAGEEYVLNNTIPVEKEDLTIEDSGPEYRPIFLTDNAITLSNKVQLILRFSGEPEDIHENYDFVHCTNYWDSATRKLTVNPDALEAILTKELRYVGSLYPVCSLIRLRKFIKRGWTINAGQILKMVMQVNALDLKNIEVLRDQLVGVDAAYFVQLIDRLEKKFGKDQPLDTTYLISIIDRIF